MQLRHLLLPLAATMVIAAHAPVAAQGTKAPPIDPRALDLLRRTSETLETLKAFSFHVQVSEDVAYKDGALLTFMKSGDVKVSHPGRMVVSWGSGADARRLYLGDGKFTIYSPSEKLYAQEPAPRDINAAIAALRKTYGLLLPAGDMLGAGFFKMARPRIVAAEYVGLSETFGERAHHLAFFGKETDWQMWVSTGDRPVPLGIVVTYKKIKMAPQYRVWTSRWNLDPKFQPQEFVFRPTKDDKRIEIMRRVGADKDGK